MIDLDIAFKVGFTIVIPLFASILLYAEAESRGWEKFWKAIWMALASALGIWIIVGLWTVK